MAVSTDAEDWPGRELGLPAEGPGSLAPFSRRVLALLVDWLLALLISMTLINDHPLTPVAVFAVMHVLLVGKLGVTLGKRIMRIQVVHGTKAPGIPRAALRVLLILIVLPTLLISPDGRGLHDTIAKTVQLRM